MGCAADGGEYLRSCAEQWFVGMSGRVQLICERASVLDISFAAQVLKRCMLITLCTIITNWYQQQAHTDTIYML